MAYAKSAIRPCGIPKSKKTKTGRVLQCYEYELGQRMRIFSSAGSTARQLVITAHGGFSRWTGDVSVPAGIVVRFLNPHGTRLDDPGLAATAGARDVYFASIAATYAVMHKPRANYGYSGGGLAALSGSARVGKVKNYTLTKFGEDGVEAILDAMDVNRMLCNAGEAVECDFLTVRNRQYLTALLSDVTLADVFHELKAHGRHYDVIVCSFCRASSPIADVYDARRHQLSSEC